MPTKTQKEMEHIDRLSNKIIGTAIEVHRNLKAGFNEKIYQKAMQEQMRQSGVKFETEKTIKVTYKDKPIGSQRIDFIVEDEIILELKSADKIGGVHIAQILSYLKALDKKLGLILNFGEAKLGIKRVIN